MDDIGTHREREFPVHRNATVDTLRHGLRKHHVPILLEIDVTEGRERLRAIKAGGAPGLSFTAWMLKCVAQAVCDHPQVHALRKGGRLVVFDDVDISVVIERAIEREGDPPDALPMPYVVRAADRKSLQDIHAEIRAAQDAPLRKDQVQLGSERMARASVWFSRLPAFLRDLVFWRRLGNDPFLSKRLIGTVAVTSIGGLGKSGGGWAIPIGIHPLVVAMGGVARKPGVVRETIAIREYLAATVLFDHDVVDGVPAARFVQRLKELAETCHGLHEAGNVG